MSAKSFNSLPLLGAALLFALAVFSLERGTEARALLQVVPPPLARPLPPQLTRFSLMAALGDHARVAADWAYVDCLQYLGKWENSRDGRYRQTEPLYREVMWLDPTFHHAVREGASVMGWNQRRVNEAFRYLQDAMSYDASDKRTRLYYVALAYAKADDPAAMVKALEPEVLRPDAPEMLLRAVGNVYLKEKDWQGARSYWSWVLGRAKEERTLAMARGALIKAQQGLASKRNTR